MLLIVYRVSSNHGKPKEYFSNALNQKWPILKRKHARDVWLRRWKELANVTFNLAQLSRWKKYSDTNIERLRLRLKESWMKIEAKNVQQRTKIVFLRVSHFCFFIFYFKKMNGDRFWSVRFSFFDESQQKEEKARVGCFRAEGFACDGVCQVLFWWLLAVDIASLQK